MVYTTIHTLKLKLINLLKPKNPLSRTILSLAFGFKLHERLVPVLSHEGLFRHSVTDIVRHIEHIHILNI